MKIKHFINKEQMSQAAAGFTRNLIIQRTAKGKFFTVALSGGSSPVRFYELLAEEEINWKLVNIFLVDERKVSIDNSNSNFGMIKKTLLSKIDIPRENIFPINTDINSVSECAKEYEDRIRNVFPDNYPAFDLIVLGIGPDGHTASLFPGEACLRGQYRLFISTIAPKPFDIPERLTMTLPLINSADNRIFIISGKGKKEIVQRVIDDDRSIPAGLVNSNSTIFFDNPL